MILGLDTFADRRPRLAWAELNSAKERTGFRVSSTIDGGHLRQRSRTAVFPDEVATALHANGLEVVGAEVPLEFEEVATPTTGPAVHLDQVSPA